MATNRSKRYEAAAKLVDANKNYPLAEAIDTLKSFPAPKFDQTVTLSFHLGVDPKQSDQMVRGTCPLPNGSGKQVRVLVFATGAGGDGGPRGGCGVRRLRGHGQEVPGRFPGFRRGHRHPVGHGGGS